MQQHKMKRFGANLECAEEWKLYHIQNHFGLTVTHAPVGTGLVLAQCSRCGGILGLVTVGNAA